MDAYYVNKNAQSNEEHEIHKNGCVDMSYSENMIFLDYFNNCNDAIKRQKYIMTMLMLVLTVVAIVRLRKEWEIFIIDTPKN